MQEKSSQIVGFTYFFRGGWACLSVLGGTAFEKHVIEKLPHKKFMQPTNVNRLRQLDLSQNFKPVRITLRRCEAKLCEIAQSVKFTLFNFYRDTSMFFANTQRHWVLPKIRFCRG